MKRLEGYVIQGQGKEFFQDEKYKLIYIDPVAAQCFSNDRLVRLVELKDGEMIIDAADVVRGLMRFGASQNGPTALETRTKESGEIEDGKGRSEENGTSGSESGTDDSNLPLPF